MIEPLEIVTRQTNLGTQYEIHKWQCPQCKQIKSTLYIDNEFCHGDGQILHLPEEVNQCIECWEKDINNSGKKGFIKVPNN